MQIEICKIYNPIKIKWLLQKFPYKPFRNYFAENSIIFDELFLNNISNFVYDRRNNYLYTAFTGKTIAGFISFRFLNWDTKFFKVPMARIDYIFATGTNQQQSKIKYRLLEKVFSESNRLGIKFISADINTTDVNTIHSLEESGFRLMGTYITFLVKKGNIQKRFLSNKIKSVILRRLKYVDIPVIQKIAKEADWQGHFFTDPKLDKKRCRQLYIEWAKKSCYGYADEVLVYLFKRRVVGFSTFKIDKELFDNFKIKLGHTPLISFSKDAIDKGIYNEKVVLDTFRYFLDKVDMVDVRIELNNIKVAKYFLTLGARVAERTYSFHKWL